jgi:hypothetical protein
MAGAECGVEDGPSFASFTPHSTDRRRCTGLVRSLTIGLPGQGLNVVWKMGKMLLEDAVRGSGLDANPDLDRSKCKCTTSPQCQFRTACESPAPWQGLNVVWKMGKMLLARGRSTKSDDKAPSMTGAECGVEDGEDAPGGAGAPRVRDHDVLR